MKRAQSKICRIIALVLGATVVFVSGCTTSTPATGRIHDAPVTYPAKDAVIHVEKAAAWGPFYERVETDTGAVRQSFRPLLYTKIEHEETARKRVEWVWPFYVARYRGDMKSWRFLWWYGGDTDTANSSSAWRTWAIPFWFQGRTQDSLDYAALWPFYGTIRDMYWDRIHFKMFPFWVEYDRAGYRTKSVLWPFITWKTGDLAQGFKIFPLYGQLNRPGQDQTCFVLWPIWNSGEYYGRNAGSSWMLFPLAAHANRVSESTWMFLPPLFSVTQGKGKLEDYRRIHAPWPFVKIVDEGDTHLRAFWPIYAKKYKDDGSQVRRWVVFPFYTDYHLERKGRLKKAWSFFPILHSSKIMVDTDRDKVYETEEESLFQFWPVYTDYDATDISLLRVWPLYSNRSDATNSYVRVPDLSLSVRVNEWEYNLLGMFTLYTRGETQSPRQVDHSALWGLIERGYGKKHHSLRIWPFYNSKETKSDWEWSILGGLIGRQGRGEDSSWRWLWFWGGDLAESQPEGDK